MSATLNAETSSPAAFSPELLQQPEVNFAQKLQQETTGCKLNTYSLSCRRSMPQGAVMQVASMFHAEAKSLSGGREIINRKHPLVKPIFYILGKAKDLVEAYTIQYPERGVRLVKLSRVEWLSGEVKKLQGELAAACADLDEGWQAVKDDAKQRLGDLYQEGDYPQQPSAGFGLEISFPAIKPDDRMAVLHPDLYREEQERIARRFQDAVDAAEQAAAEELAKMLQHLVERLGPGEDGKQKTIHESAITNLKAFAGRFKDLSIGSNEQLEQLVAQVEKAASGVDVKAVRKADQGARAQLAEQFSKLTEEVSKLITARPVRELDLD